jgi:hypothetical protein
MLAVISALVIVRTEGKGVDGRTASSPKGDEAERNPQMQKNFPVGRSLNMFSSNVVPPYDAVGAKSGHAVASPNVRWGRAVDSLVLYRYMQFQALSSLSSLVTRTP